MIVHETNLGMNQNQICRAMTLLKILWKRWQINFPARFWRIMYAKNVTNQINRNQNKQKEGYAM